MPVIGIEQGDVAFPDVGFYYIELLLPGGTRICSRLPRSRASFFPTLTSASLFPTLTRASLFSALLRVGLALNPHAIPKSGFHHTTISQQHCPFEILDYNLRYNRSPQQATARTASAPAPYTNKLDQPWTISKLSGWYLWRFFLHG